MVNFCARYDFKLPCFVLQNLFCGTFNYFFKYNYYENNCSWEKIAIHVTLLPLDEYQNCYYRFSIEMYEELTNCIPRNM